MLPCDFSLITIHMSLPVKEFWKSDNIWGSYGQQFSVLFFDSRCMFRQLVRYILCDVQVISLTWRVLHLWGWISKTNGMCDTINHFACNFAKCLPILKFLTPANWIIYLYWSNSSQLKCLDMLPCDLSLITLSLITHTHTHPFSGPFSGTTRVSRYQKDKTNLDFIEARDNEWQ